jgi:hypothetical protein
MNTFDKLYPARRIRSQDIGNANIDEAVPAEVDGKIELIARASYRLGAAEANLGHEYEAHHSVERDLVELKERFQKLQDDRNTYKNLYYEKRDDLVKAIEKVNRLEAKFKPSKKKVKKVTKKGQ